MTPPVSRFLGRGTEFFRLKAGTDVMKEGEERATEAFSPLDGGVSQGFIPFVYPCCIGQGTVLGQKDSSDALFTPNVPIFTTLSHCAMSMRTSENLSLH